MSHLIKDDFFERAAKLTKQFCIVDCLQNISVVRNCRLSRTKRKKAAEKRLAEDLERARLEVIERNGFAAVEPLGYKRDNYQFTQTWEHVTASFLSTFVLLIVSKLFRSKIELEKRTRWQVPDVEVLIEEQSLHVGLREQNWNQKKASSTTK